MVEGFEHAFKPHYCTWFCAHEKSKDMASAALAYKFIEVAYMRVVYSSHSRARRGQHELHNTLQIIPLGDVSYALSNLDSASSSSSAQFLLLHHSWHYHYKGVALVRHQRCCCSCLVCF